MGKTLRHTIIEASRPIAPRFRAIFWRVLHGLLPMCSNRPCGSDPAQVLDRRESQALGCSLPSAKSSRTRIYARVQALARPRPRPREIRPCYTSTRPHTSGKHTRGRVFVCACTLVSIAPAWATPARVQGRVAFSRKRENARKRAPLTRAPEGHAGANLRASKRTRENTLGLTVT